MHCEDVASRGSLYEKRERDGNATPRSNGIVADIKVPVGYGLTCMFTA